MCHYLTSTLRVHVYFSDDENDNDDDDDYDEGNETRLIKRQRKENNKVSDFCNIAVIVYQYKTTT